MWSNAPTPHLRNQTLIIHNLKFSYFNSLRQKPRPVSGGGFFEWPMLKWQYTKTKHRKSQTT